jgi:hypothetical protein
MFVGGEYFLPMYGQLRADLKVHSLPIAIIVGMLLVITIVAGFMRKKQMQAVWKKGNNKLFLYGIIFTVVALLPFIGLGNITERYFYLASAGCLISLLAILDYVFFQETRYKKRAFFTLLIVTSVIFIWSTLTLRNESGQWQRAGEITKKTLAVFRTEYPTTTITPASHVYFVNVPIRKENAWIFPVGLPDALWFVYRESSPKFYQVKTIQQAKDLTKTDSAVPSFIFNFDKNGDLEEVK